VEAAIHQKIEIPDSVQYLFNLEKKSIAMQPQFAALKEWLMNR